MCNNYFTINKEILLRFARHYKAEKTFGIYSDDEIYDEFMENEQSFQQEFMSTHIIGDVKKHFKKFERYEWDYKSFYNGWIEGRTKILFGDKYKCPLCGEQVNFKFVLKYFKCSGCSNVFTD